MNSGIKATLCTTIAFAIMAGIVTGCRENLKNTGSGSQAGTTQTSIELVTKRPEYVSAKDANGDLPQSGSIGSYEYKLPGRDSYRSMEKDRGYYIDMLEEENSPYYYVICSGLKNTGGYDIKIVDIGMDGQTLIVTVEETSPDPMSMVTEALDYPYCVLMTDKKVASIKIVTAQGYEFKNING